MTIQRYKPFSLLVNLQREMSSCFQGAVDIQENAEEVYIHGRIDRVNARRY